MATLQREHRETIVAAPTYRGGATAPPALVVLRRHARLAIVVFVLALAGAATVTLLLPDVYRSTATVLVEHPGTTEGIGKSLIAGELETRIQTIGQEVLSQARLTALMDSFDLYPTLRALGAYATAAERMRRDIQVKLTKAESATGRSTTVAFSITFRGRKGETVARVANTLAVFYIEENAKIRERQASAARLTRLTQELAQLQQIYTPQYPDVIRLKAEIASLERLPRATTAVGEEFRVLDPAVPAREPFAPRRLSFFLFGVGISFGVAAAAVFLANQIGGARVVDTPRIGRRRVWMSAVPVAVGFAVVVLASYYIASDNDQLASAFLQRAP